MGVTEVKRVCRWRISRWRGRGLSVLSEAKGSASAGGAAFIASGEDAELPC